jgi:hypothetical protein
MSIAEITITFAFHLPSLAIAILWTLVVSLLSGCASQKKTRVNKSTSLGFAGMKNCAGAGSTTQGGFVRFPKVEVDPLPYPNGAKMPHGAAHAVKEPASLVSSDPRRFVRSSGKRRGGLSRLG